MDDNSFMGYQAVPRRRLRDRVSDVMQPDPEKHGSMEPADLSWSENLSYQLGDLLEYLGVPRDAKIGAKPISEIPRDLIGMTPIEMEHDARSLAHSSKHGSWKDVAWDAGMLAAGVPFPALRNVKSAAKAASGSGEIPNTLGSNTSSANDQPKRYVRKGSELLKKLKDHVTARQVAGLEDGAFGHNYTDVKSLKDDLLATHSSEGYMSPELVAPDLIDIADLKGDTLMSIVGDPTGRHTVTHFDGKRLKRPVDMKAGFQYADVPDQAYAGDIGPTNGKLKEARDTENPVFTSARMGDKSGDFSRHQGDLLSEALEVAEISTKDAEWIDDYIRGLSLSVDKSVKGADGRVLKRPDGRNVTKKVITKPYANFTTIKDPYALSQFIIDLPSGSQRATLLKGLDKANVVKRGFPKVGQIRLGAADEEQIAHDWGSTGYRLFYPDLEKGSFPTTSKNSTTYSTGYDKIGNSMTLLPPGSKGIPSNLMFLNLGTEQRLKGSGGGMLTNAADYKILEGSHKRSKQPVDDRTIDVVNTFLELEQRGGRRTALEFTNDLLSGGEVTGQMIEAARRLHAPKWIIAALTGAAAAGVSSENGPVQEDQSPGMLY